ncbi:MAG: triphosphoribosyl-dephospho-CoA synthase, partial [Pseudomonadota bacterium]|nr:triphosphoribosyl-dephospho-CoA synthase [Pseudomonadota bacterium]
MDDRRAQPRAVWLADAACEALHAELALYPKPGLVSFEDNGSHLDMTAATFVRSIAALRGYFWTMASHGAEAPPFAVLERLGIAAERCMLRATGGINTHRGSVFALGLLCAAAGISGLSSEGLRRRMLALWGQELAARVTAHDESHGQRAAQRHG